MMRTGPDVLLEPLACFGMDSSEGCWKLEIFPLRALVLLMGKNLARNATEHFSHVSTVSLF